MPALLEVLAHGVTAILATWLGLLVLTRSGRAAGAPVFSFLCLLLVTWSVAIIVQRVGADPLVKPPINLIEDIAAFLLPPATLHIAISVVFEGRRSPLATTLLVSGYLIALCAIAQAALDPGHPIGFGADSFAPLGIPGVIVGWGFAVVRAGFFAAGIAYLLLGLRAAGADATRRRQLQFAVATVALGVIGGMARILPEELGGPRWIGVALVATATVMATYAILAQHLFVAADVAGRALRWSLFAGVGIVVYVGVLVALERGASALLSIDLPLVTALAVVVTIALFDPVADAVRRATAGGDRDMNHARLMQAIGGDLVLAQQPHLALEPGLARLVRTFELTGAELVERDGAARATAGVVDRDDPLAVRLALDRDDPRRGHAIFGRKRSGLSFTPSDLETLELAVDYLGSSMRLAERQQEQASALADLRAERDDVVSRGSVLSEVLADAATAPDGLRIYALGSLRAERNGEPIRRWGGEKAGSRQAEAVFGFLFDRGERGASKDEILELIWPDVDLDRADVAFHRTLLGLRSMLEPERRRRRADGVIGFHNDRYRLDLAVIAWSDVHEFERLVAQGGTATTREEGLQALEQARALYRGDYLDDCPFYGDSAAVEDRRSALRGRYVDLLIELGDRYVERGDRTAAAACFRDARGLSDEDLPRVAAGLGRLASPRSIEPT